MEKQFSNWVSPVIVFAASVAIIILCNYGIIPIDIPTDYPKMIFAYLLLPIPYIGFVLMVGGIGTKRDTSKVFFILQIVLLCILICIIVGIIDWKRII